MCASTLWPLESSTRNIAFGRASTIVPSISMTPSFLAIASTIRCIGLPQAGTHAWKPARAHTHADVTVYVSPFPARNRAQRPPRGPARSAQRGVRGAGGLEPLPATVEGGEHPQALVGDRHGVLPVGG